MHDIAPCKTQAKLMWTGLCEYRSALEDCSKNTHEIRSQSHQEVKSLSF
jgi:hypothetical protein